MTGVHDVALFVAAGLLLNVTPGPDMAYIAARSAAGGFRDGAAAVFGITAGCVAHTLAAAIGLSALLAASATAFEIVKWCGALYLLYAGIRLLIASAGRAPVVAPAQRPDPRRIGASDSLLRAPPLRIFREALLINVFNPKVALFFLAFVALGTLFNVDSLFVNLPVAWLASRAGHRLRAGTRGLQWMQRVAGGLFIVLAARLAAFSRS
jgi:threonine/homoserine/homoserine lactone efflux protein